MYENQFLAVYVGGADAVLNPDKMGKELVDAGWRELINYHKDWPHYLLHTQSGRDSLVQKLKPVFYYPS